MEDHSNRTRLAKLLRFYSSNSDTEMTSLAEYVERMKDKQEHIYFIAGSSRKEVESSPFVERLLKKGFEVRHRYFLPCCFFDCADSIHSQRSSFWCIVIVVRIKDAASYLLVFLHFSQGLYDTTYCRCSDGDYNYGFYLFRPCIVLSR